MIFLSTMALVNILCRRYMILDYQKVAHIFIVCGKTDLRKGIDGLAAFVMETYQLDVFDHALFLFCGSKPDRFKAL